MTATPTRKTGRRLLMVGVPLAILLAVLLIPGPSQRASLKAELDALRTGAEARKLPRTVLRGSPVPGSAWDEYQVALDEVLQWKEDPNGAALGEFAAGRGTTAQVEIVYKLDIVLELPRSAVQGR